MNYKEATQKLDKIGQGYLLQYWDLLSFQQKADLLEQIKHLDISTFHKQQQLLQKSPDKPLEKLEPFTDYALAGQAQDKETGLRLIASGKVGCLLIAGGQGTRLRFNGPKGMFPITIIKHKSLFQLFAEKVAAASKQAGRPLPLAVMTSPLNHAATAQFFINNHFFGLSSQQITFFSQDMLPFLDPNGNLFLEERNKIAQGPDGNGYSLKQFVQSGIWDLWKTQGIEYLNYVTVDNPLADPFDAELIGFHHRQANEITIKCTWRKTVDEKVGLLTKQNGHVRVVEYSEMPDAERTAKNRDGSLRHQCANLSLFCFSMDFVQTAARNYSAMPLHSHFKTARRLNEHGEPIRSDNLSAWKFETFIFDCLPMANKVKALLYPREVCFAPLKNFEGPNSPQTVQEALLNEARRIYTQVTGHSAPSHPFELSQEFYYPTQALIQRWKNTSPSNTPYIE